MLQMLRNRLSRDEKGFTLIELLVVILIIGILAAIALPSFLNQRTKAENARSKSDVRTAASQVESCGSDTANYAGCGTNMPTGVAFAASGTSNTGYSVTKGAYSITKDPGTGAISTAGF